MEHSSHGNSDRITREYFEHLLLEMRNIDSAIPNTALELYGETFATPIMTAALSHLKGKGGSGMVEMAAGARAAGAVMWCGMGSTEDLEGMTATGARVIKIIKPYADNAEIFKRIRHAEKCGVLAVGMDVDHSFGADGQYDHVLGFDMTAKTLEEIKAFAGSTKLPFIIKGVLSVKDAVKCMEAGVAGIVVSHHHGILRYAVPPLMVLPAIHKAVGGKFPIFVDCGVESGYDAFKALALGASAVCVGRALMAPQSAEGADGVWKTLEAMTKELAGVMARTCCPDLEHMDPTVVHFAPGGIL